jgi:hypothetical protein
MSAEEQILTAIPIIEEPEGAKGAEGAEDPAPEPVTRARHVCCEGSNVRSVEID